MKNLRRDDKETNSYEKVYSANQMKKDKEMFDQMISKQKRSIYSQYK